MKCFLTEFHFLQFQIWPKIHFWSGKKLKTAKNAISRRRKKLICLISRDFWLDFFKFSGPLCIYYLYYSNFSTSDQGTQMARAEENSKIFKRCSIWKIVSIFFESDSIMYILGISSLTFSFVSMFDVNTTLVF